MKDIRIFTGKQVRPVLKTVLSLLECRPDNPIYEELEESFGDLEQEVRMRAKPKAALVFDTIKEGEPAGVLAPGSEVLYLVVTVGESISNLSRKYFDEGDYLNGMLVDAMADSCLFQFEEELLPSIKLMCQEVGRGVQRRYEAPTDIPMEMQKTAYDAVEAERTLGLGISSGYMYHPVKSTCQVFELTGDNEKFELEHNCSKCPKTDCPLRKVYSVKLQVSSFKGEQNLTCNRGNNLMQELIKNDLFINAVCGGNGKCGKCKIRVTKGNLPASKEDRAFFAEEELDQGMRLACMAELNEDISIIMDGQDEAEFEVLGAGTSSLPGEMDEALGIAIDIGTTTLALSLVGLSGGGVYDTYTAINSQRSYGADVIARMQASNEGKKEQLQETIRRDLKKGIFDLAEQNHVDYIRIKKIAISANTTMGHLLMGYSCETLGMAPFVPVSIHQQSFSFSQVFGSEELSQAEVVMLQGISTFVGADITAGLYQCGFHRKEGVSLLVDLGTNGEMAIGGRDQILVTSTAAGPAFEGGNIAYGIGSIPGAINRVKITDGRAEISTIGEQPPQGICGTGVVEIVAELLAAGLLDETGMLEEDYFEDGFPLANKPDGEIISFTQKDVREIQLAKAAVRAGIETLMLRFGVAYQDVDRVYLAGGFGFFMNQEKASAIGMLPPELVQKTTAAGNTSLNGAIRFLTEEGADVIMPELAGICREIPLSTDASFNEFYMDYMMFEA